MRAYELSAKLDANGKLAIPDFQIKDLPQNTAVRIIVLIDESSALAKPSRASLEALTRLREIGRRMPSIDAVQLAQASRTDLEQRGLF